MIVFAFVLIFALGMVVFANEETAIKSILEAVILEAFEVPLKTAIDKTNAFIEIDVGMLDVVIKFLTIGVQMGPSEFKVVAGILKQEVLARSKDRIVKEISCIIQRQLRF